MVSVDLSQNIGRVSGADLSGREFVDDAIAGWPLRRDRLIAIARHAAVAVGTLVSEECDHTLARTIDRTFFQARALAPSALDWIGLLLRLRRGGEGEQQHGHDDHAHAQRAEPPPPNPRRQTAHAQD